jgi:hypothetical protein
MFGHGAFRARQFHDQPIALAAERLRRGIIDEALGGDEEVRIGTCALAGKGMASARPVGVASNRPLVEPRRQGGAPGGKAGVLRAAADGDRAHQAGPFGHADLGGAGQPLRLGADRQRAPTRASAGSVTGTSTA